MKPKLQTLGESLPRRPVFSTLESEEMISCYNQADLYIHAAGVEVECMSVLEAMACGLPPLIADSRKSATRQFALDDRSLFEHGDLDHLIEKMDYWIEHPSELTQAKKRYRLASLNYSFDKSFTKLEQVYSDLTDAV